jgi:outer membrane protein assembly factor BamB
MAKCWARCPAQYPNPGHCSGTSIASLRNSPCIRGSPDVASPLANDDYLILPSGYGVVDCLNAKTGKVFWEDEFDRGFYRSPILVNDRVSLLTLSKAMESLLGGH